MNSLGELLYFMKIDKELLEACIEGDRKSQSKLYDLSFSILMSIAFRYRVNRDDALSLVNECFLKILFGLKSYKHSYALSSYFSWIKKIMMNTIIDEFRKNKKENELIETYKDEKFVEGFSMEEYNLIENDIEDEALQNMLNRLKERPRNVFNLYAIDGLSHKEISAALSISVENAKWHLIQARKQLQMMLKEELEKQRTNQHG